MQEIQELYADSEKEKTRAIQKVNQLETKLNEKCARLETEMCNKKSELTNLQSSCVVLNNNLKLNQNVSQLETKLNEKNSSIKTMETSYKALLQDQIDMKDEKTKRLNGKQTEYENNLAQKQDQVYKLTAECSNLKAQVSNNSLIIKYSF